MRPEQNQSRRGQDSAGVELGEALLEEKGGKRGLTAHLAVCPCRVCVHVYLSVKRLVDVHSVVLALLNERVAAFPDESRGRVGVDGAAQEHRLLLVVAAAHVADGLVHRQNWCVEVCGTQPRKMSMKQRKNNKDSDLADRETKYC